MTIEAYPFNTSKIQNELQWQRLFRLFIPDGVDTLPTGNALKVTSGSGLGISISGGHAVCRGFFYRQSGNLTRTALVNTTILPRVDRVVLRCDLDANTFEPVIITGTPSGSPVAPAMTYTESVFDLPLATIRVESNDTISQVIDTRRFIGRPVVYCSSNNRPDDQGRPLVAFEVDTSRLIYSPGNGHWRVGLGDDAYRPVYVYSGDNGSTTSTTWDTALSGSSQPVVSATFTAPVSGRAMITIGAYLAHNMPDGFVRMGLRLLDASGNVYWRNTDTPNRYQADRMIRFENAKASNGSGASCSATFLASSLTPGVSYTATLQYVVNLGTGGVDDRFIEIQPLP